MPWEHIAGHYNIAYYPQSGNYASRGVSTTSYGSAVDFGETINGFELEEDVLEDPIYNDSGGDVPVDGINRGQAVRAIRWEYTEFDKVESALSTHATAGAGLGNVGLRAVKLTTTGKIVLTPAIAGVGLKPYTFYLCKISGNFRTLLANRHRTAPIQFTTYPYQDNGAVYAIGSAV